jgi:Holliday junction resolvase-like predicted endonuclease
MFMKIRKSSRHSKITGDFGEALVLYLLSKYGFECANVDHTGIDIIARDTTSKRPMGISVKTRSRNEGREGEYINIPNNNFSKVEAACKAFNCDPYFAIVSDEKEKVYIFILSMAHLLDLFPNGNRVRAWTMTQKSLEKYASDKDIMSFEFNYKNINWWQ